jgi:hypothetical protein
LSLDTVSFLRLPTPTVTLLAPLLFLAQAAVGVWIAGPLVLAVDPAAPSLLLQAAVLAASAVAGGWIARRPVLRTRFRPSATAERRVLCGLTIAFTPAIAAAYPPALLPLLAVLGLSAGPELWSLPALARSETPPGLAASLALLLCVLAGPALWPYLDARRAALVVGICTLPWALPSAPGPALPRERNIPAALLCLAPAWAIALALGAVATLVLCCVLGLLAALARADRFTRALSLPRSAVIGSSLLVLVSLEGAVRRGYPLALVDPEFPVVRAEQDGGEWLLLRARSGVADDLAFHGEKGAFLDHLAERRIAEALVHPALSAAPGRQRVLLVGGECTPTVREILRYPDVERVTQVVLYPHWWRFCQAAPMLAPPQDPRVAVHPVTTTAALVQRFKEEGENSFDAALVNLPETVAWPAKVQTAGFHSALRGLVRPGGVLGARLADLRRPAFTSCLWSTVRLWWPKTRLGHVLVHLVGALITDTVLVYASDDRTDLTRVHFPPGTRAFSNDNRDLIFTFGADRHPWRVESPPPESCARHLERSRS